MQEVQPVPDRGDANVERLQHALWALPRSALQGPLQRILAVVVGARGRNAPVEQLPMGTLAPAPLVGTDFMIQGMSLARQPRQRRPYRPVEHIMRHHDASVTNRLDQGEEPSQRREHVPRGLSVSQHSWITA